MNIFWNSAIAVIGLAAALLTWFHKEFAQIRFSKIYILELSVLAAFVLISRFYSTNKKTLSHFISDLRSDARELKPFWIFFLIGALRLLVDLPFVSDYESRLAVPFALQYSLVWVYPLLWTSLAFFIHSRDPKAGRLWLTLILGAQLIPGIWDERYRSVALGPFFICACWMTLSGYFSQSLKNFRPLLLGLLLTILAVLPMWRMWHTNRASRTAFVISIVLLIALPLIFSIISKKIKSFAGILASILIGIIWGGGMLKYRPLSEIELFQGQSERASAEGVQPTTPDRPTGQAETPAEGKSVGRPVLKQKILDVLQHSEDRPISEGESSGIAGRTRKILWKFTLMQWLQQPIMGVGFLRFVPMIRGPGIINDPDRAGSDNRSPINGSHNSYLTILARLGVVGMLAFIFMSFFIAKSCLKALQLKWDFETTGQMTLDDFFIPLLFCGILASAIYATFNVGLESPQNGLFIWLFSGILIAELKNRSTPAKPS